MLDQFSLDPYGSGDFICKFCSDELSNVYMHCDGCERLLNKDFNICTSCHANQLYRDSIQMHPFNPKRKSTLNHTGNMSQQRRSHCPCKNGPQCHTCLYCIGCSCTCHQQFTLNYRFMPVEEECELLKEAEDAVGADVLLDSLETKVRLFSLLPDGFQVPIDAFANDGIGSDRNATHKNQDMGMVMDGERSLPNPEIAQAAVQTIDDQPSLSHCPLLVTKSNNASRHDVVVTNPDTSQKLPQLVAMNS